MCWILVKSEFVYCLSVRKYCWIVKFPNTVFKVCSVKLLANLSLVQMHCSAEHCNILVWWHSISGSVNPPEIKKTLWPCSIILFLLLLSSPSRILGGVQKSCWTRLNTWATSASATWNTFPSLSPLQPTLLLLSCLSTPTRSNHPVSPCTPTRASLPPALELRSLSPRSNPCDMPHNS